MNENTNDVIDYYSEEVEGLTVEGKSKQEIAEIIYDVSDLDKEFNYLYNWLNDAGENDDAELFRSLFNEGVEKSLSQKQIILLKKHNFHIFSKIQLAIFLELQ